MKKSFLLLLLTLLPMLASAYDAVIDGIYYNLNQETKKAEVTYKDETYKSYSSDVVISSSITYHGVDYSVVSIGWSAFRDCSSLTSITIPNSVTSIGYSAFWGCSGLTSINIPNSVTSIGDLAFAHCSNLLSITIPNSVTSIGHGAFYESGWYNSLPDGLVYAGLVVYEYKGGKPLGASVEIKEGTKGIATHAFQYCSGLTSIIIPNSVTIIGEGAFAGCSGLTSITIPNSVTSIGYEAFYGCSGLTSINIPNSVTSIGGSAFAGCI